MTNSEASAAIKWYVPQQCLQYVPWQQQLRRMCHAFHTAIGKSDLSSSVDDLVLWEEKKAVIIKGINSIKYSQVLNYHL